VNQKDQIRIPMGSRKNNMVVVNGINAIMADTSINQNVNSPPIRMKIATRPSV
jgi:hypothetical protein